MKIQALNISQKVALAFFLPLVVIVIFISSVTLIQLQKLEASRHLVQFTYELKVGARELLEYALDMETAERGYIITGSEEFLAPYNNGKRLLFHKIKELMGQVTHHPDQVTVMEEIERTLRTWDERVGAPYIRMRSEVRRPEELRALEALVAEARGKELFDRFRSLIGEFIAEEERLLGMRLDEADRAIARPVSYSRA